MLCHSLLPLVGLTLLQGASAASIMRRDPTVSSNLPAGFNYLGCYVDSPQDRQLTGASYTDTSGMTEESCISFCSSKGYEEAGLEYGSECYCGHQFQDPPNQVGDSECNSPCAGDSSEVCGAANRLSVFSNGTAAPVTNPGTNGWTLVGCYNDSATARTLSTSVDAAGSSGLTISKCVSACQAAGYSYAGAEYGDECYCDTAIRNGAMIEPSNCDITCSGNASEYCGGAFRIDVYRLFSASTPTPAPVPAGWTSLGCYNDNVSARTLSTPESVDGGSSNMTIEGCLSACQSSGFNYAGVEYGQECYCDNQIENGAGLASDPSACHYPCSGNTGETCGGSSVLNLYSYSQSNTSTTTSFPSSSSSLSTTSQSLTATSTTIVTTAASTTITTSPTTSATTTTTTPSSTTTTTSAVTTTTTTSPITSATTTTTTTTTSAAVTTTTTTSATTTTTACVATSTSTSPYLSNGDFEQGLSGWTTQAWQGSFQASVLTDNHSYHGCRELSITPTSTPSGNRQFALSTTLNNLVTNAYYTVSLAVGRPTTVVSPNQAPYIALVAGQRQIGGGYICGFTNTGPCPSAGNGGSAYQIVSANFQATAPGVGLQFVVTWTNALDDAVLLDAVSVSAR